jgi:mono/diheme cytochrome c family protein
MALALSCTLLASGSVKADVTAGAALFQERGCARCHGVRLEGTRKGPALADLRRQKAWSKDRIIAQITNGGQKMPPFSEALSSAEIRQLTAFLRARRRPAAANPPQSFPD